MMRPLPALLCLLLFLATGTSLPAEPGPSSLDRQQVLRIAGKIDELLEADLTAKAQSPLPIVTDEVFVRRAYVRIVGRIPTLREAASFLDSTAPDKRSALIEDLVASPGYDSSAFNYFADLLRLQTSHEQYGLGWHVWLRNSLAEDKPWNQLVHEMLAAEGHAVKNPAVGYYLRDRGMLLDNVSNTVQVFLGHQIGCAQCHDHPFDKWTQMEYYELAAFSGGVGYDSAEARGALAKVADSLRAQHPAMARNPKGKGKGKGKDKDRRARANADRNLLKRATGETRYLLRDFRKNEITDNPRQELTLPDDYQYEDGEPGEDVPPATLFGAALKDVAPEDRREAFADWVTSPANPYFTKVIANRLWDRSFGHGLVDPVDDWNDKSLGSHPAVLAYLTEVMKEVKFRTRDFERILYHTRLFQREVPPHEASPGTDYHFVGPQLRRLSAEELYDSFTVLAFGNTDDNINTTLEEKWEQHQHSVLDLLDKSGPELIKLGKVAKVAEDERREFQSKRREIQIAMQKARKSGDEEAVRRLQGRESALRRETRTRQMGMTMMGAERYPGRGARASLNMRASEHPTPFRGDHFVRQFGGSDRNTTESAHTQASIPQALTLLNGNIATSAENRKTKIYRALAEITNPEQRLEYLFLAIYGCRPTAADREEFLPLASDAEDLFTLARAMLTSKRFLFVQ